MLRRILLVCFVGALVLQAQSQSCDTEGDFLCCDADFNGFGYEGQTVCNNNGGFFPEDGYNSDFDCGPVNDPACTIPLDGGLSLLALAGGGLATAAMRRRREEEEAAQGAA